MKRFFKLLSFEFNRLTKMYVVLLCLTLIFQMLGVILTSEKYMGQVHKTMQDSGLSQAKIINQIGHLQFSQILSGSWFRFSIMICIVVLVLFIFWIWYRDWLGKNTFIYRLLMLPTSRLNLYFAKLGALLVCIFGLIAFQLLLLPCEMKLFQVLVPPSFRSNFPLTGELTSRSGSVFSAILPLAPSAFIIYYSLGIVIVLVLFTAVLFERSFHLKGIILGVVYTALSIFLLLAPVYIEHRFFNNYLYPIELFSLEVIIGLVLGVGSIGTSHYLLKQKITV